MKIGVVLAILVSVLGFAVAEAWVGVSITPGELAVSETVEAGEEITLPAFQVRNPGDQPASYRLTANGLNADSTESADPEWFTLTPTNLELAPGQTAQVTATVRPGPETVAGRYAATIQMQFQPQGGGSQLVAAAAAKVFFDVASDPPDTTTEGLPWWWVLLAATLAMALGAFGYRRITKA